MARDAGAVFNRRSVGATFALYRRYPWLFLVLATAVIVPYELISYAATGSSALSREDLDFATQSTLTLITWTLVTPLVSALDVHAVTGSGTARSRGSRSPTCWSGSGCG